MLAAPLNVLDERILRASHRSRSLAHSTAHRHAHAIAIAAVSATPRRDLPSLGGGGHSRPQRRVIAPNTSMTAKYAPKYLNETVHEAAIILQNDKHGPVNTSRTSIRKGVSSTIGEVTEEEAGQEEAGDKDGGDEDGPTQLQLIGVASTKVKKNKAGYDIGEYHIVHKTHVLALEDRADAADDDVGHDWEKVDMDDDEDKVAEDGRGDGTQPKKTYAQVLHVAA